MSETQADVIVVGGGVAGLCAALAAHEAGARVRVLEAAPVDERGGNTAYAAGWGSSRRSTARWSVPASRSPMRPGP